jgi:hypothetical protein
LKTHARESHARKSHVRESQAQWSHVVVVVIIVVGVQCEGFLFGRCPEFEVENFHLGKNL